ncbi:MAG TPA: hypothetical protein PKM71_07965 [Candidatus Cloacimonas sp.]|nr:hypothetical protein [Candidatus Cloacimonas sp.]
MANKSPYKDINGMRLPGVTTITGQELGWNKGILIDWANKKGLDGIETRAMVDDLADIGTLAHQFVLDQIKKVKTNTDAFSKDHIKKATNCLESYNNWAKNKVIEPILLEERLISEKLKFGGTPDFYGKVDGIFTLTDYKTGRGIYDEYLIQVAGGYLVLLEELGHKVERIEILNIPRSAGESFQVMTIPEDKWGYCKKIFLNCLDNYKTKKLLTD